MSTIFAIVDPTSERQPALARAVRIASKTGAKVLAFLCVYKPLEELGEALSARKGKHRYLESKRIWLEGQIEPYLDQGVEIEPEIYWNEKWYESTVFASAKCNADLVLKSVSHHSGTHRKLFKTSDYMLMRHSASPVLLVSDFKPWSSKRLLAALDLESSDRGHQRLNDLVMSSAGELARHFDLSIYLLSVATSQEGFVHLKSEKDGLSLEQQLGERYGIPCDHVLLRHSSTSVTNTIVDAVRSIDPDLLVMGTLARTGVVGLLVGNTAEKVLDRSECDVLTVSLKSLHA